MKKIVMLVVTMTIALLGSSCQQGSVEDTQSNAPTVSFTGVEALHDNAGSTDVMQNTFRVRNTLTVKDFPPGAKKLRMWLAVPQTDAHQVIQDFKITSSPGSIVVAREPENHNKFVSCDVMLGDQKSVTLEYEFTITRKRQVLQESPNDASAPSVGTGGEDFKQYLGSDRNIILTPEIASLADEICGEQRDPVKQARLIYDWIIGYGEYWKKDASRFQPSGHGSTEYFLQQCTGNCTDFHAMFLSLMRSRDIPTRIWFGGVFWEDKEGTGKDISYHCWPEFWAEGIGWIVVDASQGDFAPEKKSFYFGNLEARRIVFTQGRDLNLAPRQDGARLEYFAKGYAEIDGQPVQGERTLSYWK